MALADNGDVGWRKWLMAGWAFLECFLFGGLLYGWGSIEFVLKDEGIYADLCPEVADAMVSNETVLPTVIDIVNASMSAVVSTIAPVDGGNNSGYAINADASDNKTAIEANVGNCKPQDGRMALCFTIGSAMFCVGCAVLGHVSYKYGTRITRIISIVMFVIGGLLMAFISKETPWLMYPGLSLLGTGGLPLLVTNTQVSNLFTSGSSSVVGLLCGGFDMSSAIMLIVKLAHEGGFARKYTFLIITVAHVLVLVSTFLFLPKDFIKKRSPQVTNVDIAEEQEVGVELLDQKQAQQGPTSDGEDKGGELPSLRSCMLNPKFILHTVWLSLLQLRFYYFLGTLNKYLNTLFNNDKQQVSYFTNVCFYIMMFGLISSFSTGIVYDIVKKCFKNGKSSAYRDVLPAALPLAIGSVMAVLLSILVLIESTQLLYLIFIVMTILRSFLYSMAAAFISAIFPSEYFGILYGVMIVSGGLFGFLQFAFFLWSRSYPAANLHANLFLLVLVSISFIHPICLWISCWRQEKKYKVNQ